MGWQILPPISHGYAISILGASAAIEQTDKLFEAFDNGRPKSSSLQTARTSQVMKWSYSPLSGHSYHMARLQQADSPNGVVYRVNNQRALRILLIEELWGSQKDSKVLIRSIAKMQRAHLLLVATGPGSMNSFPGTVMRRGCSYLAVRILHSIEPDPLQVSSWRLTLGDLEGAI